MNTILNSDYEVLTPNGFKDFKGIKKTQRFDNIKLTFNDSSTIIVTPEHRFLVCKGIFRRARKLKVKHKILDKVITDIEYNVECSNNFYDLLDVEDGHIYNTSSVVSHNCGWIDSNKYDGFEDSVMPTIATADNTQVVKISTPNGLNHFYKAVQEAKNGTNGYVYFEVHWSRIDIYTPEWAKGELKRIGPIKFNQNYAIQFIGSSNTLLKGDTLALLIKKEPLDTDFLIENDKIFKVYNPNSTYAITVDSSKTIGNTDSDNDYISVNVLELGKKIEQVYSYRTNSIHYTELAGIIYDIGEYFNFPLCIVENNEGSGTYTANRLFEHYDYPNMYFDPSKDGLEVGIRTKVSNRGIGLSTLKKLIEANILLLNDADTIDEFFTFIKVGKRYEAQSDATDDCIMSLNLLMYILMDINNDLEITINDYLEGTIIAKDSSEEDESTEDVNFVANSRLNSETNWLTQ